MGMYRALLGLWIAFAAAMLVIVVWSRLTPDHGNEAPGIAFAVGLIGLGLSALPIVGLAMILDGKRFGGLMVATVCGVSFILATAGISRAVLLFLAPFLALNVWAGVRATRANPS